MSEQKERSENMEIKLAPRQERLIPMTDGETHLLRKNLVDLVSEYLKIEAEKEQADSDFGDRLKATWKSIQKIEAQLRE